ncbi:hypothetical protein [Notoacmeibacter sp. MSK16QG-6]|uniref:hypothetical protein n=1 Tax=Notoacmeibacter sp. MSK16QG-6 TaxID=2957982 RepID=UPI0020A20813|nr:hypothetical protein [Notoacmeibacter sp. MSK16QG-6]MCP1200608.1 hypothetical protein [Notoacmeibacter sp. MSK16QG-6]
MSDYEDAQADTETRFLNLGKLAKLHRLNANWEEGHQQLIAEAAASEAAARLAAYSTECLTHEVHKNDLKSTRVFHPELQAQFEVVSRLLDEHVGTGPDRSEKRRAVLRKAEAFVPSSEFYEGESTYYIENSQIFEADKNFSHRQIADSLNEREGNAALPRYLLDRELGLKPRKPDYTGWLEKNFDPDAANALVRAVDELQSDIRDRARTLDDFSTDGRDAIAPYRNNQNDRSTETARLAVAIATRDADLEREWPQDTLRRIDDHLSQRRQAAEQVSNESFFDSSSEEGSPLPAAPEGSDRKRKLSRDDSETERPRQVRRLSAGSRPEPALQDDQADISTASEASQPPSPGREESDPSQASMGQNERVDLDLARIGVYDPTDEQRTIMRDWDQPGQLTHDRLMAMTDEHRGHHDIDDDAFLTESEPDVQNAALDRSQRDRSRERSQSAGR